MMFYSTGLFACSCPIIKGLNEQYPGFATMNNLLNHTFLVEVIAKTEKGVSVKIKTDYKESTDLEELFLENNDPNYTCSHSTDPFIVGQEYLIVLYSEEDLQKPNSLSICYESFINVTENQIEAQVIDLRVPQIKIWTKKELEKQTGLVIN